MISKIIDNLIDQLKQEYSDLDSILLVGSYATGNETEISDIDLCIIGKLDDFIRVKKTFQGKDVELIIAPIDWYYHVIQEYERKDNFGTVTSMISSSKVLYTKREDLKELILVAKSYYTMGPTKITNKKQEIISKKLNAELNELILLQSFKPNKTYLRNKFISTCIDNYFVLNNMWYVKDKRKLNSIKEHDEELYKKICLCLEDVLSDKKLENMLNHILSRVSTTDNSFNTTTE